MGVGNRILMLENAIYSVISPESCAAIVWRDASQAELAAQALRLTSSDLFKLGIIDEIVPEPGEGAHADHDQAARSLGDAIETHLKVLAACPAAQLIEDRYNKFRVMGNFFEE